MKSVFYISIISILFNTSAFSFENADVMQTVLIQEVPGYFMPDSEEGIIKKYQDDEGNPMPVVFRGVANEWEAANLFKFEFLLKYFGDTEIAVVPQKFLEEGLRLDEKGEFSGRIFSVTNFKEHINNILTNPTQAGYFLAILPSKEYLGNFLLANKDFSNNTMFLFSFRPEKITQFPKFGDKDDAYTLLIGSEYSVTSLHSHGTTFLAQIYGKKAITLVNPKHIEECYCLVDPDFSGYAEKCDIDIINPDFEKFPKLKGVKTYTTVLEPGDLIYIPDGWLHDIRALTPSISIANGLVTRGNDLASEL